jgi:AcrR family transcriptional regulator
MFSGRSIDQVAVEEIAEAAGISEGLLFHYFPTKRDYLVAVVRAAADELLAVTDPDPALPVADGLRAALDAYVDYIETNRAAYVSLVRGALGADQRLATVFDDTRRVLVERIISRAGVEPAPEVLVIAVRGWVAMVEEAAIEWLRDRSVPRAALIGILEDVLMQLLALAGPAARNRPRRNDA